MSYYQRMGKIDRRQMTYGMGRFQPTSYKNYRGANIFTDIFEIGQSGIGNAFLHGRIYDPSELGISSPFPDTVEVDGVWYQYNPNDRPPNANAPFDPNTRTFNSPRTLAGMSKNIKQIDRKEIIKNRGMHGVGHNQTMHGVNPGIYREKDQEADNHAATQQPVSEQSSILAQQLRRNIVKGERLLDTLNMTTGEIEKGNDKAFIGEKLKNIKGNKNTFFLNPANRPLDGSHKDLSV